MSFARLFPDRRERGGRGDGIGVDAQLEDRRLARGAGALERRREVLGALHDLAVRAECARIRGEVRIPQLGAEHAPGVLALLVHADRAVKPVIDDQRHERRAVLHCRRDFLSCHQEVAVAAQRDHVALRQGELGGERGRVAIAHRAVGRSELGAEALVAEVPVQPAGEVAGAAGDDRVLGKLRAEPLDHLAVLQLSRHRERLGPLQVALPKGFGLLAPLGLRKGKLFDGLGKLRIA